MEKIAGRFAVRRTIGEGGMGAVFEVVDEHDGRTLALKRLLVDEHKHKEQLSALFQREYHTLSRLAHPGVIEVYDYGVDEVGPFYTMELLEGDDLRSVLPLPYGEVCALLCDVASALSLLHSRQLVHRDITTRNIRVLAGRRAKLLDFGALAPIGYSGPLVGTMPFVAPEALFGQPLDPRSDLFSLGVTLYQAISGQVPYRGRNWEELRASWQEEPADLGSLVPGLPSDLVRLTMSLVASNRSGRPRSASQVMEELGRIAGMRTTEPPGVARSYLRDPDLVGREAEILRVRAILARAREGRGGGLMVMGPAGVGRTRLLDEAMLEARMAGAVVLAATGNAAGADGAFGIARLLTQTLVRAVPGAVRRARENEPACTLLFLDEAPATSRRTGSAPSHDEDELHLANFHELVPRRADVIAGLRALYAAVSSECDLVITVDDFARVDEPTAAWLGTLLRLSGTRRLVVLSSIDESDQERLPAAHRLVATVSGTLRLRPFDVHQTGALVRQLFGAVPNVDAVAASLFRLSQGSPRDVLTLCEHMVDAKIVQFRAGGFFLPERLRTTDLPSSISAAHSRVVAMLSSGAVRLGRAIALAAERSLTLADIMELAENGDVRSAQLALDELGLHRIVSSDGYRYRLVHDGWASALSASLDVTTSERLHRALANLTSAADDRLLRGYHLLLGNTAAEALAVALALVNEIGEEKGRLYVLAATRLTPGQVARYLDLAIETARRERAPLRDLSDLEHTKMMLGVFVDYSAFDEMRPIVVEDLKRDSGYDLWVPPETPDGAMSAAFAAMAAAHARYEATPIHERRRSPEAALRALVQFAAAGIAVGAQASDWSLRRSLPELLRPFAPLSPIVDAIYENCCAVRELGFGQYERYRARTLSVLDSFARLDIESLPYGEEIRSALVYGSASAEARLGMTFALERLVLLEEQPRLRANAMDLKAYVLLTQGDWRGAASAARLGEQLQMDDPMGQMFGTKLVRNDADLHALGGDLGGVERVVHQLEALCAKYPGWLPSLRIAQAQKARLRGDLDQSAKLFEQSLSLLAPLITSEGASPEWYSATAGRVEVLLEAGRATAAMEEGRRFLDLMLSWSGTDIREIRFHGLTRALALAESAAGAHDVALARLEPAIGQCLALGTTGVYLGILYEARAQIALSKGDNALFERSAHLATEQFCRVEDSAFYPRARRLSDPKYEAELRSSPMATTTTEGLTAASRRTTTSRRAQLVEQLSGARDAHERARHALETLCQAQGVEGGHLLLLREDGLTLAASRGRAAPDSDLVGAAQAKIQSALAEGEMATVAHGTVMDTEGASLVEIGGHTYFPVIVGTESADGLRIVGLALLAGRNGTHSMAFVQLVDAIATTLIEFGDVEAVDAA
jgi:hypothetical protein